MKSIDLVAGDLVLFEDYAQIARNCTCCQTFKCLKHIGDYPLSFIKEHIINVTGSLPTRVNVFYDAKNGVIYVAKSLQFKLLTPFSTCVDV